MISRGKIHKRLISEGEFATEDPNFNTHYLMSRSVASASENWTCNLSSPRNESGICGSGGMVGSQKDEMIEIDGFDSREICRSSESLRARVSPDERLCRRRSGLKLTGQIVRVSPPARDRRWRPLGLTRWANGRV